MADGPELAALQVAVAEEKVITRDQHCVNCGYNLRTLPIAGKCPECGTPVIHSLHNNELRFSNPEWVAALHFGVKLMLWMIPIGLGAGFIGAMSGNIAVLVVMQLTGAVLNFWASWLLTTPEPRPTVSAGEERLRKLLRFFAVAGLIAGLTSQLGEVTKIVVLSLLAMFAVLVTVPYNWVLLLYFRRLALRIPNPRLAKSASIVMWGLTACLGVMLIGGIIMVFLTFQSKTFLAAAAAAAASGNTAATAPAPVTTASAPTVIGTMPPALFAPKIVSACVIGLAGVGFVVFTIWFLILMFRMNRALGEAAKYAALNIPKVNTGNGQ